LGEQAVKGAMVYAQGTDINHSGMGRTDNDGQFDLDGLEAGTYRVELRHWESGIAYDETVELSSSREITLRVPTARIVGQVVDSLDLEPLAGARLTLNPPTGMPALPFTSQAAVSDLNGRFEIGNVPDGSWVISSNMKGYATATVEVTVQHGRDLDDLKVKLDPTEGLILNVQLPSGTAPDTVQTAVLDLSGGVVTYGSFATGENGRVRLSNIPPGTWDLVLGAAGAGIMRLNASAPGGPIPVALPNACRLTVEVPDLAGSAVPAHATLTDSGGRQFLSLGWLANPTAQHRLAGGRLEMGALPPGTWTVRVTATDGDSWEGATTTTAGSEARLVLE
jgi:hypothetical protein